MYHVLKIKITYEEFSFQTRKSKSETVFEVRTKMLGTVPIVDFYPVDYGLPHQAFGFEVGPVCFK